MGSYAVYEVSSGAVQCIQVSDWVDVLCLTGESIRALEVGPEVRSDSIYIDTSNAIHFARKRRPFNPQYDVSGLTVTLMELPSGTVISVGKHSTTSDGEDEIEFDVPGVYRIELRHPHYLDDVVEVTLE